MIDWYKVFKPYKRNCFFGSSHKDEECKICKGVGHYIHQYLPSLYNTFPEIYLNDEYVDESEEFKVSWKKDNDFQDAIIITITFRDMWDCVVVDTAEEMDEAIKILFENMLGQQIKFYTEKLYFYKKFMT